MRHQQQTTYNNNNKIPKQNYQNNHAERASPQSAGHVSSSPLCASASAVLSGPSGSTKKRWVPPSTLVRRDHKIVHESVENDAVTQTRQDIVFRKVRGVLNKLTPEKFEKLTFDILNVGLDSTVLLKGVILLIFEKALDEPKYSSMYAQLCKRLAENAPNFDPPDERKNNCTFRRLLLNKCRDEFENRARLVEESKDKGHTEEDDDARFLAKRKMLGNIKFIGELGKLQIVHDSILHRCCEQLLVGRRKQPMNEQAEDLECLCHLMKTCGRILDTPKAKVRMDQYFDRLMQATENEMLPIRIRFMIQDIMDMRRDKWIPRKLGKAPEGPRTIQQVREDAFREGCIYMPQASSPPNKPSAMNMMNFNPLEGSFFDTKVKKKTGSGGLDELFGGFSDGYMGLGRGGPGTIQAEEEEQGERNNGVLEKGLVDKNGIPPSVQSDLINTRERSPTTRHFRQFNEQSDALFNNNLNQSSQPQQQQQQQHPSQQHFNRREQLPDFGDRYSANRTKDKERRQQIQFKNNKFNMPPQRRDLEQTNSLPPRFKKMVLNQQPQQMAKDAPAEVSLRPQTTPNPSSAASNSNVMVFKPKTPSMLPKSAISKTNDGVSPLGENSLLPNANTSLAPQTNKVMMQQEAPIMIKQSSLDKNKKHQSKSSGKGPTKDEVCNRVDAIIGEFLDHRNIETGLEKWKEDNWIPSKLVNTAVIQLWKSLVARKEVSDRNMIMDFSCSLVKDGSITISHCQEAMCKMLSENKAEGKDHLAEVIAKMVENKLMTFKEMTELCRGQSHPTFLLILQKLNSVYGQEELKIMFDEAFKMSNLADFVLTESSEKNDEKLTQVLDEFNLVFLLPMLKIQQEMYQFLTCNSGSNLAMWIEEHVDKEMRSQTGFVQALISTVVRFIYESVTCKDSADSAVQPDKTTTEIEKNLLAQFCPILQTFVRDRPDLQLSGVYALQVFCHSKGFPKGLLLRLFVNFYEMDVMDEQAFLKWKEDVNDSYPGKGKALFQVNQWLTWLEEAESEDEDDEDDE